MVIEKTLRLKTGEGGPADPRGEIVIQISHNTHPSAIIRIRETIWPRILEALIERSSSVTISEW